MDIERAFISKVIRTKEISKAVQNVKVEFFHDPAHIEVWVYVLEFWTEYSQCPSADRVRMEFPDWQLDKTPDPLEAYLDLLLHNHKRHSTRAIAIDASEMLRDEDIDGALFRMSSGVIEITQDTVKTEDIDIVASWEDRMDRWIEFAKNPGALVGIPTGFSFIDTVTGGLHPEQFIVLLGPPKAGKSSICQCIGKAANQSGNSVMIWSHEMSNLELEARYDAMAAGFNPNKLLRGEMSKRDFELLEKALEVRKNYPPFWLVHDIGNRTMTGIMAKVLQYKPDLLIIDGMHLMEHELGRRESFSGEGLTQISRAAKRLARTNKFCVLGSVQASNSKWDKSKGLTENAAMYSQAFAQDCDAMIGIEPADEDNHSTMRRVLGRNFGKGVASITFDWDRGLIEERENWTGEDEDDLDDDGWVKKTGTDD